MDMFWECPCLGHIAQSMQRARTIHLKFLEIRFRISVVQSVPATGVTFPQCPILISWNIKVRRVDKREAKKEKKKFLVPNPKKTRHRLDGLNASGWYGRLLVPISPLLVFKSVQLWQQSFHVWHFLVKIDPSPWYSCITTNPNISIVWIWMKLLRAFGHFASQQRIFAGTKNEYNRGSLPFPRWGWLFLERTRILSGIQFTRFCIQFAVVETKQFVSSTVNVILTQQTSSQHSSMNAESKHRALDSGKQFLRANLPYAPNITRNGEKEMEMRLRSRSAHFLGTCKNRTAYIKSLFENSGRALTSKCLKNEES